MVIVLLIAGLAVVLAASGPDDGANIGAGFFGVLLDAIGLPWSAPSWVYAYSLVDWPDAAFWAISIAPAMINLGLHVWWVRARSPRRAQGV
jgi:hypothetical protein